MAEQTLTFNAVADTYVNRSSPSSSYSTSYTLKCGLGSRGNATYAAIFGFDTSSIPANKIIKSIKLRVYLTGVIHYQTGDDIWIVGPGSFNYGSIVTRARRLNDYALSDIDTLSFNTINQKADKNNIFAFQTDPQDYAIDTGRLTGNWIYFNINDLSRSDEIIIALFRDEDFVRSSLPDIAQLFISNFASKEYAAYAPQLIVTIDDYVPPKPTNLIPNNTSRNKAGEIRFSWNFVDEAMGTSQASYQLMYSTDDFITATTVTGGTDNYHILPANTFTEGQIVKWKVKVTDSNGDTTDWSDVATFTIGATVPSMPEIIDPVSIIVNSTDIVYFRWKFIDQYGYTQAKFDLQYKADGQTETTITVTDTNNYYAMPANTLGGGNYSWRVRCYNAFGEVSPYTNWVPFYSIGKPSLPIITSVTNSMHPTITWTAPEQDLFILKLYQGGNVVFDSGEQISNGRYTIPEFINNGTYTLGLRVRNIYGFWSDELLYSLIISTTKPSKPNMTINIVHKFNAAIIITSSTNTNLIYRKGSRDDDFKLIAIVNGNSFIDYSMPAGTSQYFVRSMTDTGYNDSDIVAAAISFKGIILSGADNLSDYIHIYLTKDSDKRKVILPVKDQYEIDCNGRVYPIVQSNKHKKHTENHEYFIKPDEFDTFYRIANYDTLLYRNSNGYSYKASIKNVTIQEDVFGYIVSFTLSRLEG